MLQKQFIKIILNFLDLVHDFEHCPDSSLGAI